MWSVMQICTNCINKNTRTLGAGQSLTSNFIYLGLNSDNIIYIEV